MEKVSDLSIFGHVVINDEMRKIGIARYGFCSSISKYKMIAKMVKLAWNNGNNTNRALMTTKMFAIHIEENDTSQEVLEKIDVGMAAYNSLGWAHMCTSQVSTFYQMIAMSQLTGSSKGNEFQMSYYDNFQ